MSFKADVANCVVNSQKSHMTIAAGRNFSGIKLTTKFLLSSIQAYSKK